MSIIPKYLYKCKCNKEIEVICSMKDYSPTVICPTCGEIAERKPEDLVCGLSIDKTGDFYRSVN